MNKLTSLLTKSILLISFLTSPLSSFAKNDSEELPIETQIFFEKEFKKLMEEQPEMAISALYAEKIKLNNLKALLAVEEDKAKKALENFEVTYKGNLQNIKVSSKLINYAYLILIGKYSYQYLIVNFLGEKPPELGRQKLALIGERIKSNPNYKANVKDLFEIIRLELSSNPKILKTLKGITLPTVAVLVASIFTLNYNNTEELKMDEDNLIQYSHLLTYLKRQIVDSENQIKNLESIAEVQKKLKEFESNLN